MHEKEIELLLALACSKLERLRNKWAQLSCFLLAPLRGFWLGFIPGKPRPQDSTRMVARREKIDRCRVLLASKIFL